MRATMKQNRAERKAMADSRAMEEQMERHNPISGTGATPSMGLSQVRGGAKMMKNAAEQGKMLMEHLGSLHGGAYAKQFHEGMKGAGFFSNLGHGLSDVAGMFGLGHCGDNEKIKGGLHTGRYEGEGRFSDLGHKVSDIAGMFGLGKKGRPPGTHKMDGAGHCVGGAKMTAAEKKAMKSVLEKHEGGRRDPVPYGRPQRPVMELMDGIGYAPLPKPPKGKTAEEFAAMAKMMGKGKVKRVVGAGDGRRKRAEVVRKVMAEKGMKMIEASKYVKEHGLYKP